MPERTPSGRPLLVRRLSEGASLAVLVAGLAVALALNWVNFHSALTSPGHVSTATEKPPTWDFTNLWIGGRLVLEGRLEVLLDVEAYRAELRAMFSPVMADSEWSYPPLALAFGAPLALLPLYGAYATPLMRAILEAYAGQAVISAAVLALTAWLWRLKGVDAQLRLAAMGPLVLLATPYSFSYDMVLTSVSVLILFVHAGYRLGPVTATVWVWPSLNHLWNYEYPPVAPFLLMALAAVCVRQVVRSRGKASATPPCPS